MSTPKTTIFFNFKIFFFFINFPEFSRNVGNRPFCFINDSVNSPDCVYRPQRNSLLSCNIVEVRVWDSTNSAHNVSEYALNVRKNLRIYFFGIFIYSFSIRRTSQVTMLCFYDWLISFRFEKVISIQNNMYEYYIITLFIYIIKLHNKCVKWVTKR